MIERIVATSNYKTQQPISLVQKSGDKRLSFAVIVGREEYLHDTLEEADTDYRGWLKLQLAEKLPRLVLG